MPHSGQMAAEISGSSVGTALIRPEPRDFSTICGSTSRKRRGRTELSPLIINGEHLAGGRSCRSGSGNTCASLAMGIPCTVSGCPPGRHHRVLQAGCRNRRPTHNPCEACHRYPRRPHSSSAWNRVSQRRCPARALCSNSNALFLQPLSGRLSFHSPRRFTRGNRCTGNFATRTSSR